MKFIALIPAVFAASIAVNAQGFDPVGNAHPERAADPEQAERMAQMMEIWNSMTPAERAASNAEKHNPHYQMTVKRHIQEDEIRDFSDVSFY